MRREQYNIRQIGRFYNVYMNLIFMSYISKASLTTPFIYKYFDYVRYYLTSTSYNPYPRILVMTYLNTYLNTNVNNKEFPRIRE